MRKFILHKMELNDAMRNLRTLAEMFTNSNGKRLPITQNFSTDTRYVQVEITGTGITVEDHFPETDFEALDELVSNARQLSKKSTSVPALLDAGLYAVFGATVRKAVNHFKTTNGSTVLEFDNGYNFDIDLPDGTLFFIDDELNFEQLGLVAQNQQDAFIIMRKVGDAYVSFTSGLSLNILSTIVTKG